MLANELSPSLHSEVSLGSSPTTRSSCSSPGGMAVKAIREEVWRMLWELRKPHSRGLYEVTAYTAAIVVKFCVASGWESRRPM